MPKRMKEIIIKMSKCDVCHKEIEKGKEFRPSYIPKDSWIRKEGLTCSINCSLKFLQQK